MIIVHSSTLLSLFFAMNMLALIYTTYLNHRHRKASKELRALAEEGRTIISQSMSWAASLQSVKDCEEGDLDYQRRLQIYSEHCRTLKKTVESHMKRLGIEFLRKGLDVQSEAKEGDEGPIQA
jgi:hypothetical protein